MKVKVLLPVLALLSAGFLTACTPDISAGSYTTGEVGQAARTESGVIIAARPVHVANASGMNVGTLGGAALGGIAGSAIGGGTRMNLLGAVGGALVGGAAGNYAENKISSQTGIQYTIRLKNRSVVTITQGMDPILNVGQHVFVIFGNPARVISE
jgi:outer membrane lipoprotein SlyB